MKCIILTLLARSVKEGSAFRELNQVVSNCLELLLQLYLIFLQFDAVTENKTEAFQKAPVETNIYLGYASHAINDPNGIHDEILLS